MCTLTWPGAVETQRDARGTPAPAENSLCGRQAPWQSAHPQAALRWPQRPRAPRKRPASERGRDGLGSVCEGGGALTASRAACLASEAEAGGWPLPRLLPLSVHDGDNGTRNRPARRAYASAQRPALPWCYLP